MNVLILTTDAGGGHRSVARALAASFAEVGGPECRARVVDFIAGYAPFPLSRTREVYNFFMRHPKLWSAFYTSTNTRDGWAINAPAVGLAMQAGMRRLLREHAPDLIVATHPLAAPPLVSVLHQRKAQLPYYTVVTDFGHVHTFWTYPFGEAWFAPCEETARHLVHSGVPARRVVISGYPVHPRFARRAQPAAELRRALGLEPDRFTALLVGGAEGVGPVEEVAEAVAGEPGPWQLIVIAGRNQELKERLQARAGRWAIPVHVDGLVEDMPSRMHAADLLLSKGGPATLSEGLTCGLPALLISVLPGQEEHDAQHFERLGVARRLAEPAEARVLLEELAAPGSAAMGEMLAKVRRAARPLASENIVRHILSRGKAVTAPPMPPLIGLRVLRDRAFPKHNLSGRMR